MDEFIKEFLAECQEGLNQFETELLELEKDPRSQKTLSSIFRIVHSIKGSSGFLGFKKMAAVTHEGEDLLGRLRDGRLNLSAEITSGLLGMIDAMREILASIEATKTEGDRDHSPLLANLRGLLNPPAVGPEAPKAAPAAVAEPACPPPPAVAETVTVQEPEAPAKLSPAESAAEPEFRPPPPSEPSDLAATGPSGTPGIADATIRVDVGLLDKLMNLVGELVLTRNQILRCSIVRDETTFQAVAQRLNQITTELQEGMMKTRMQPIRNLASKLPRVVRDLSLACGKQARLITEGEETEIDKTIIEAIKDPITHIIRNAVDHGVELPEKRAALGKPTEGILRLRAYHEGGMVNIEVSDDGAGIDAERIRHKAIERGWLPRDQAERWSERELLGMIFRPGFSTAESLTMVSGRGVGMDVVKNRVESVGGSVDAQSKPGLGTTIKLKIPLTLTIINTLIVSSGGERFAIPQVNLVELIRLQGENAQRNITSVQGAAVCRYRGRLLPLLELDRVLDLPEGDRSRNHEDVNIVVLQADDRRFGLIVGRIDDAQEIVVRPLARQLKGLAFIAGATIMGDGRIALILDVFRLARLLDGVGERAGTLGMGEPLPHNIPDERHALLLLRGTDGAPLAVPLAQVDRLEAFPASLLEWIAGRPLVQYRGTLLPLVDVSAWLSTHGWQTPALESGSALGTRAHSEDRIFQVVIHKAAQRQVGLVFDKVVDVVEESLDVRGDSSRDGVSYTAAVQGRATEVLDLDAILRAVDTPTAINGRA